MSASAASEAHVAQLLRMHAGLEEAIIRLEARDDRDSERLIGRLRLVQDDIAAALKRLEEPEHRGVRQSPWQGSSTTE